MRLRLPFLLVFVFLVSASATAQQTPQRDPQAVILLQQSLAAMGGSAAISLVQDSTVQGSIQHGPASGTPTVNFVWKQAAGEFRHEMTSSRSSRIFLSGHGNPSDLRDGKLVVVPYHVARANLPLYLPAVTLLRELNDPNYTIKLAGPVTIQGRSAWQVHTSDDRDRIGQLVTPQEWYFDAVSGLPLRVEFRIPDEHDAQQWLPGSVEFADFRAVSGVVAPFQLMIKQGPITGTGTVSSVVFNSELSPSQFDLP